MTHRGSTLEKLEAHVIQAPGEWRTVNIKVEEDAFVIFNSRHVFGTRLAPLEPGDNYFTSQAPYGEKTDYRIISAFEFFEVIREKHCNSMAQLYRLLPDGVRSDPIPPKGGGPPPPPPTMKA